MKYLKEKLKLRETKSFAALFDAVKIVFRYSPLARTHPPFQLPRPILLQGPVLLLPVELNSCTITGSGWILDTKESLFLYEMIKWTGENSPVDCYRDELKERVSHKTNEDTTRPKTETMNIYQLNLLKKKRF